MTVSDTAGGDEDDEVVDDAEAGGELHGRQA